MENDSENSTLTVCKTSRPPHSTKLSDEKKECYKNAWIAVKEGKMTIYGASKQYDVSIKTLWNWCQRDNILEDTPSVGRPCFFGQNLENKLKQWIFEAARTGLKTIFCLNYLSINAKFKM